MNVPNVLGEQKPDATQGECDAQSGEKCQFLVEEHRHQERYHKGIDEKKRRGDTCIHITVALKQEQR